MRRGAADLNLLLVFEAVLQDRSVSKAAVRLGLSQPAMSHALKRLRHMLKDELFVRTPAGMVPTPRAEALAWPVRRALTGLEEILEPETFVPASAERRFVVAVNNYAAVVLAPAIAARCVALAPRIRLTMRPSGTLDLVDLLDRGELDLVLSSPIRHLDRIGSAVLLADDYVAVMRGGHPNAGQPLSLALLASIPHLLVSSSPDDLGFIDSALQASGLARTIAVEAPFLATGRIIMQSDMIAILARNVARVLGQSYPVELRDIPIDGDEVVLSMQWARRFDEQPAHRWLRELVHTITRDADGA